MSKLKDYQDTDELHNPSKDAAAKLKQREDDTGKDASVNAGIDQLESYANDSNRAASKNIDDTKNRENEFGYEPHVEGAAPQSLNTRIKGLLKSRKAATGGIIGTIIALIGFVMTIVTPGLAAVQLKEILTDDLNDQVAAMDIRTNHVFKAKLKDLGKGVCTGVKVRCGFKGMSDRQLEKFKKAGIKVDTDGRTTFGYNKVIKMTFTDEAGHSIVVDDPSKLNRALGQRVVRTALRKAFNPKFMGLSDAVMSKVLGRYKSTKADKLGAGTEEDKNKAVDSAVAGEPIDAAADKLKTTDDKGNPIDGTEEANAAAEAEAERLKSGGVPVDDLLESTAKSGVTSAAKGLMITGAADTACTVKNTARGVEAAAKVYRAAQLARYAMVFLTFADMIKAGTATGDQAEYVGNKLTAVDNNPMIVNEDSPLTQNNDIPTQVSNPNYGKNAFDSAGYKVAMYNDAPRLSARDMQYTVGGGARMGSLSKINNYIDRFGGGNCKLIQNSFVRLGSLGIGLLVGAVSFGTSLAVSIGASVAIGMALPILENYLAQIVAGKVVSSDTKGVDSGDAIFAGTAVVLGSVAQSRGMKPASKSDLKSYLALSSNVQNEYIAAETAEAKEAPFDVSNRYSFLGSLARTMMPVRTTSSVSVGLSFSKLFNLVPIAVTGLSSTTYASTDRYNEARFSQCKDYGYEKLGIDADVFCNVRYTMSSYELGLDTDEVNAWMNDNKYVSDDGTPQNEYSDWLDACANRITGFGETPEGQENGGEGFECVKNDKVTSYFRVYTMDHTVIDAMEYVQPVAATSTTTGAGSGDFSVASYNIRNIHNRDGETKDSQQPYFDRISDNIKNKYKFDVVGTQEMESADEYNAFKQSLSDAYEFYPKEVNGISKYSMHARTILYKKDRFEFVKADSVDFPREDGTAIAPIVWLRDKESQGGQQIIVINTHNPADVQGMHNADQRASAAQKYVDKIKELKNENLPILFTGDFNEGWGVRTGSDTNATLGGDYHNLFYCKITSDQTMRSLSESGAGGCPHAGVGGVDYIYATPEIQKVSFDIISGPLSGPSATDHDVPYAHVTIPGSGVASSTTYKNPVIDSQSSGESIIRGPDGTFHLYATGGSKAQHYTSKDTVHWQSQASMSIQGAPRSATGDMWKPNVSKVGNMYVMVFAGGPGGGNGFDIYYATSSNLNGPFKFGSKLVSSLSSDTNAIDPQIFTDENGSYYLYYTNGRRYGIRGVGLSINGSTIRANGTPKALVDYDSAHKDDWTIEAPYVIKKDGYYYLIFSTGNFKERSNYMLHVARSNSPLGGFIRKSGSDIILQSNSAWVGPGTTTMFTDDANQDWMIYAARYPSGTTERVSMLDKVTYDAEGWPIVNGGSGPSNVEQPGPAFSGSQVGI